mmetsp:Transcript_25620/g.59738  ORF Transcript_25620/g.59738 Transcript_25620/m.59738 type:complete len:541 (+) Transcript_25620:105-1727(+)
MLAAIRSNEVTLKSVQPTVTRLDGSKYIENLKDGTSKEAYVEMLESDGLPLPVVKSRLTGTHGIAFATRFIEAVNGSEDGGDGAAAEDRAVLRGSYSELHGHLGDRKWAPPRMATRCGERARPGYAGTRAHEFLDEPEVLRAKVKLLAELFRRAETPVIYAGAGLSTSAGVSDYATRAGSNSVLNRAKNVAHTTHTNATTASDTTNAISGGGGLCGAGKVLSPFAAKPALGHHVIAALARAGHVWRFIQQNHDGLPQKAGMPQHLMNEIHGGWFDPSNPVVKMSGNLRSDLFADLLTCEENADLVLAVGTSLSGMNADRVVSTCASKATPGLKQAGPTTFSCQNAAQEGTETLGSVIVSLQRTPHDANSSLRIYALIDDVMSLLAEELELEVHDNVSNKPTGVVASNPAVFQPDPLIQKLIGGRKTVDQDVFEVPYSPSDGLRTAGCATKHTLDLREGARVMLTGGPQKGEMATVTGRNVDGHWRLRVTHRQVSNSGAIKEFGEVRLLGSWWAVEAMVGTLPSIPVVTVAGGDAAASDAA